MTKASKFTDENAEFISALTSDLEHAKSLLETKKITGYAIIVNYQTDEKDDRYSLGLRGNALDLMDNMSQGLAEWVLLQQSKTGTIQ
jgi:hypothetical protein